MITFRVTTEVKDDRHVVLTLPPEVPTGETVLVVTVADLPAEASRTSAALLAAMNAEPRLSKEDLQELEVFTSRTGRIKD
jgi:hypothetical protein